MLREAYRIGRANRFCHGADSFQRLRSALDGLHQGAGLGLAFAKAIIELHGGSLRIESEPGKGTRILVSIPFHGEQRAAAA